MKSFDYDVTVKPPPSPRENIFVFFLNCFVLKAFSGNIIFKHFYLRYFMLPNDDLDNNFFSISCAINFIWVEIENSFPSAASGVQTLFRLERF